MTIPTTSYQKHLCEVVSQRFGTLSAQQLLDKLFEMGVVDFTRCKVLAVRQFVEEILKGGAKKVDAMWRAAEYFGCSYEYVRKCMYYYVDVNVE